METIKILITKELIAKTQYQDCSGCALWHELTKLGYERVSVGGRTVDIDGHLDCPILSGGADLVRAFGNKRRGEDYGDVVITLEVPYLPNHTEPKERVIYRTVVIDSTVKELSGQLTNN